MSRLGAGFNIAELTLPPCPQVQEEPQVDGELEEWRLSRMGDLVLGRGM